MLRIGICEDDTIQKEYLVKEIQEYYREIGRTVMVTAFESAEELLFQYPDKLPFDCVILDIKMKQMDGMKLAERIRQMDARMKIIFITGDRDYVFDGYKVGAVRYILKPYKRLDLVEALTCVNDSVEVSGVEDSVYLAYQGSSLKLGKADILYVQVQGHYIDIYTIGENYNYKESMTNIRKLLDDEYFVMANRSTLINLQHVEKITRTECFLDDGNKVAVSRGAYEGLNRAFLMYYS